MPKIPISKPILKEQQIKSGKDTKRIVQDIASIKIKKKESTQLTDDADFNLILDQLKKKKRSQESKKLDEEMAAEIRKKEPNRKFTEEGWAIYTAQELKIGQPGSGNTPLCPFDCDCCF